jgi:hypothetical protein
MQTIQNDTQKVRDSEQMWFWFISSNKIRNGLRRSDTPGGRICELVDIETLITRLHLSGRISREQLGIMVKFGERRRAPNQHVYSENRNAMLWRDAMNTLQIAASAKGWIL